MVKALILEDEDNTREFLKKLLLEMPEITQIFDTPSGEEAITWTAANQPNIVLLDIELKVGSPSGLDVAKAIYKINKEVYIIFITGYSKYAVDSFEVHPYSYIIKPINIAKFKQLIGEIINKVGSNSPIKKNILTFKVKNEVIHIDTNDIVFIEAQGHKTFVYTQKDNCELRISLDEFEKLLSSSFLRSHRSFIVNITKIKKTREVLDRSYEIEFWDYSRRALMSRYYYSQYKKYFTLK
jgi:DNA-binding LytR/AlgR family response regulator